MMITSTDPMLAFAELLINADYARSELDHQNLQAAREEQARAEARQVAALHDAADSVAEGAWVQGAFTVAGSVCGGASTLTESNLLQQAGSGLSALAGPAGNLAGTAPRMHAEARAEEASQAAEHARWKADDARDHSRRVAEHSDRILDGVAQVLETEHAGELAILANG